MTEREERLEQALLDIRQWAQAYPVTVFLPVLGDDLDRAADILQQHGISLTAIHGGWARHLLGGITDICEEALQCTRRTALPRR